MCGIVGYVGARPALGIVLDGLRRLEYRGYDSAGVAICADGAILTEKRAGKLANLEKALGEGGAPEAIATGTTGIGHTRWATHGGPTDRNAHPHLSRDGRVAVIHNGIIENFAKLRAEIEADGVEFASDTDTECAAHLLAAALTAVRLEGLDGSAALAAAMRQVCQRLEGAFTLLAVDADVPGAVVGARRNSPLVVGRGEGENFLASDVSAFIEHTREAVELGQDQVVLITADGIEITDFGGAPAEGRDFHIDWDASAAEKGGYDYFMLKEIAEQPQAVADTLLGRLTEYGRDPPRRGPPDRPGPARRRQGLHRGLRHRVPRRAWSPSTRSSTGRASRARSSWPASSATATRCSTGPPWSWRSRSPARRWTR